MLSCTLAAWPLSLNPVAIAQDAAASQQPGTQQPAATQPKPLPIELMIYPLDVVVTGPDEAFVVDRNMHGVWQWKDGSLSVYQQGTSKFRTPLNAPRCVAVDQDGQVLVGDSATREIYRIVDGQPVPLTGGQIGIPMDLAVAADGTIYIADVEMRSLFKLAPGAGKAEEVAKVNPRGVFVDDKNDVWVVSQDAQQVQVIKPSGEIEVVVGKRVFEFPHQIVVNAAGEAFVTDGYKKGVWKVVRGSEPELIFSGPPLDNPVGIALDKEQRLVVVDPRARKVFRFNEQNEPLLWFEIKQP